MTQWLNLVFKVFLLSFTLRLPTAEQRDLTTPVGVSQELNQRKKKEYKKKLRKKQATFDRVSRNWKSSYQSSRPKGARFSNQRSLRRMYRAT